MQKYYSITDHCILQIDAALKTLFHTEQRMIDRATPGSSHALPDLDAQQTKHVAGLMRVNHAGEVCAQALYQGQALTAKLPEVRDKMIQSAEEEIDHLGWCEQRLQELGASPSYLNGIWYLLSFSLGATAGLIGDKWSLGFVVETERQVTKHLESHLDSIPESDLRSREILKQMVIDETAHASVALEAGGAELPFFIKTLMTYMSKLMTHASYYF